MLIIRPLHSLIVGSIAVVYFHQQNEMECIISKHNTNLQHKVRLAPERRWTEV